MRPALLLALLLLAACAGSGTGGAYVGGSVGTSVREDSRSR